MLIPNYHMKQLKTFTIIVITIEIRYFYNMAGEKHLLLRCMMQFAQIIGNHLIAC